MNGLFSIFIVKKITALEIIHNSRRNENGGYTNRNEVKSYLFKLDINSNIIRVPTFFSKCQIPGFLKVFGPKFHVFSCQITGTFIQILVIKISQCVKIDYVIRFAHHHTEVYLIISVLQMDTN